MSNCVNYELCETGVSHNSSLCKNCQLWGKLQFIKTKRLQEKCMLCGEKSNNVIKFPYNCHHIFCVNCTRYILFCDEISLFNVSPVPFGCPPCPNNCINPERGTQCQCVSYDKVIEDWWNQNIDKGEEFTFSCYLDGKTRVRTKINCPICSDNEVVDQEPYSFISMINYMFVIYPQYLSHYLIES